MEGIDFDREKIKRYFIGEYSENDASYVEEVFCDSEKEKELRNFISKQFDELSNEDFEVRKNLDHILYKIHYDINIKKTQNMSWNFAGLINRFVRMAGIIILPVAIFWGVKSYLNNNTWKETWVEIKAPAWTRAQFSLPDGTKGWLNSNSNIKYSGNFNTDRQITLTGEAFFDVYKNNKSPFIVNTNEVKVTVSGTRFNIASYENEKKVEVVLEEGRLIFNDKEMNNSYMMNPNDLVIYDKALKYFSTEVVQPNKYLSWTEGKLVFRNDPLDVIAKRLERWYNIDVELNGCLDEDLRLHATFINEGLEEVLNLLKRSLPIDYRIENGDIALDETYIKKKVIISPRIK